MEFNEPSFSVRCECMMGIGAEHDDQKFTALDPFGGPIQPGRLYRKSVRHTRPSPRKEQA